MIQWRETLNQNRTASSVVSVVVIVASLLWMFSRDDTAETVTGDEFVWFYDLNTGELFTEPQRSIPPIETPSGPHTLPDGSQMPAGVRAYVFTCAGPEDPGGWFIGYLESYTPEARRLMLEQRAAEPGTAPLPELTKLAEPGGPGRLIRAADGGDWVVGDSEPGSRVTAPLRERCPDPADVKQCLPAHAPGAPRYQPSGGGQGFQPAPAA